MTVGETGGASEPGSINIGTMHGGAVASGAHARAISTTRQTDGTSPALLAAVTALRDELARLAELQAQLTAAEEDIEATGRIAPGRLEWLRERIAIGATAATGLAAAGQAAEQLARLIGGQG